MKAKKLSALSEFDIACLCIRMLLKDLCSHNRPRMASTINATVEKLLAIASKQEQRERSATLDVIHELVHGVAENAMDDRLFAIGAVVSLFLDSTQENATT